MDKATLHDIKEENSSHVTVKVQSQRELEVYFRINRDVPLHRLMEAYCDRLGLDYDELVFSFDGRKVKELHTPRDLKMQNENTIEVLTYHYGG